MSSIPHDLAAFLVEAKRRTEQAGLIYRNEVEGTLDRFHGIETIARHDGAWLYELRYSGGMLR